MTATPWPTLQAALKIDPDIFPANLFLGASLLRSGSPAQAVAPLERPPDSNPTIPTFAAARRCAAGARSAPRGRGALSQARQAAPQRGRRLGRPGASYERLARRAFRRAPEGGARVGLHAGGSGNVRVTQQQYVQRVYLYKQAIEKEPGLRGVHEALAEIYRRTEHPDWASVEARKEQALPPLDCEAGADQSGGDSSSAPGARENTSRSWGWPRRPAPAAVVLLADARVQQAGETIVRKAGRACRNRRSSMN